MRLTTLCFLVRRDEVLLAMKKRGFGAGKFNGVGGKVEAGELVLDAAIREAEEEIGVKIAPPDALHRAGLRFYFDGKPEWNQECDVFIAKTWRGEPQETEEMKPQWFSITKLPFEKMWIDDPLWLPRVLKGERLDAEFNFNADGSVLLSHKINSIVFKKRS